MSIGRKTLALLLGIAAAAGPAAGRDRPCQPLPAGRIAVQLYTLNNLFYPDLYGSPEARRQAMERYMAANRAAGTGGAQPGSARPPSPPADPAVVDRVLGQIAALGYRNVELFRDYGMSPRQLKAALDRHGLRAIAGHGSLEPSDFDARLEAAATMGQRTLGSSGFGPPGINKGLDSLLETARNLNALGRRAAARGIKLYVHNHTGEFDAKYPYDINRDGRPVPTTAWEIVAAETDPRYVHFELDVYWAYRAFEKAGGGEAGLLGFIRRYSNRIILYHVKEAAARGGQAELGQGVIDWPAIYRAGRGVQYYIFEADGPADPMRSAGTAYDYMRCRRAPAR